MVANEAACQENKKKTGQFLHSTTSQNWSADQTHMAAGRKGVGSGSWVEMGLKDIVRLCNVTEASLKMCPGSVERNLFDCES